MGDGTGQRLKNAVAHEQEHHEYGNVHFAAGQKPHAGHGDKGNTGLQKGDRHQIEGAGDSLQLDALSHKNAECLSKLCEIAAAKVICLDDLHAG